jgi:hypothetical protein
MVAFFKEKLINYDNQANKIVNNIRNHIRSIRSSKSKKNYYKRKTIYQNLYVRRTEATMEFII